MSKAKWAGTCQWQLATGGRGREGFVADFLAGPVTADHIFFLAFGRASGGQEDAVSARSSCAEPANQPALGGDSPVLLNPSHSRLDIALLCPQPHPTSRAQVSRLDASFFSSRSLVGLANTLEQRRPIALALFTSSSFVIRTAVASDMAQEQPAEEPPQPPAAEVPEVDESLQPFDINLYLPKRPLIPSAAASQNGLPETPSPLKVAVTPQETLNDLRVTITDSPEATGSVPSASASLSQALPPPPRAPRWRWVSVCPSGPSCAKSSRMFPRTSASSTSPTFPSTRPMHAPTSSAFATYSAVVPPIRVPSVSTRLSAFRMPSGIRKSGSTTRLARMQTAATPPRRAPMPPPKQPPPNPSFPSSTGPAGLR